MTVKAQAVHFQDAGGVEGRHQAASRHRAGDPVERPEGFDRQLDRLGDAGDIEPDHALGDLDEVAGDMRAVECDESDGSHRVVGLARGTHARHLVERDSGLARSGDDNKFFLVGVEAHQIARDGRTVGQADAGRPRVDPGAGSSGKAAVPTADAEPLHPDVPLGIGDGDSARRLLGCVGRP